MFRHVSKEESQAEFKEILSDFNEQKVKDKGKQNLLEYLLSCKERNYVYIACYLLKSPQNLIKPLMGKGYFDFLMSNKSDFFETSPCLATFTNKTSGCKT